MAKRRVIVCVGLVICLIVVIIGFGSAPAPAQPIVVKFGSPLPGPPSLMGIGIQRWQDEVQKRTGGRVKFQNYWAGSLFSPGENLDAVEKRFTDIVSLSYVYVPGKLPLVNFALAIPFRPTSALTNVKIMQTMFDEIPAFDEELARHKAKRIYQFPIMNYDISCSTPVRTLADFKGKKLAVISLWFPDYAAATGAIPVSMPAGERYVAFERGVLDGQILTLDLMDTFKHQEVQKHLTLTPLGAAVTTALVANVDAWKSLPADIQKTMLDVGKETGIWHGKFLDERREGLIKKWEAAGVTTYTLSPADAAKWAELVPDTAARWAKDMEAKGYPGWKIMERYIELAEKFGHKWPRKFAVK